MGTIIIIGIIWLMLTIACLWLNYRFHRCLTPNELDLNIGDSLLTERDEMIGQLELQFSKAQ
jgi:hypothetical protein